MRFAKAKHIPALSTLLASLSLVLACADPLQSPEILEARSKVSAEHQAGFDLYIKNNCQGCHGINGSGNGPLNKGGRFDMADFRKPEEYRNGSTIPRIRNSIEYGVDGGRTGMQAYQNIPAEDRESIAAYINWLQKQ
jgi:mono/diheme cytochrome c family protein